MAYRMDSLKRTRILHFGSYLHGENDVVYLMKECLQRLPHVRLRPVDPALYSRFSSAMTRREGRVHWLHDDIVRTFIEHCRPNVVICNAGGLSLTPAMHEELRRRGILRVGIALSDPDDFATRTKLFSPYFDVFYTNTEQSLPAYESIGVQCRVLPFAADASFHRPLPNVRRTADVVVVGGARPERKETVARLRATPIKVCTYGQGWRPRWLEVLRLSTAVHGMAQVRAINSAPLYLSFAQTVAGHTNVKVGLFEAAACGVCVLVERFPEVQKYFTDQKEIVLFDSDRDLVEKIQALRKNPEGAQQIGAAARQRVLTEHTWEHRWQKVLEDIHAL